MRIPSRIGRGSWLPPQSAEEGRRTVGREGGRPGDRENRRRTSSSINGSSDPALPIRDPPQIPPPRSPTPTHRCRNTDARLRATLACVERGEGCPRGKRRSEEGCHTTAGLGDSMRAGGTTVDGRAHGRPGCKARAGRRVSLGSRAADAHRECREALLVLHARGSVAGAE
jgi:hypothetical protein